MRELSEKSTAADSLLSETLTELLVKNISANPLTKKKQEFKNFARRLTAKVLTEDAVIAVFRLQTADKQADKLIQKLSEEAVPFVHSNRTINEAVILASGSIKVAAA